MVNGSNAGTQPPSPAARLAELVGNAMRREGVSAKELARRAEELHLPRLKERNILAYASGSRTRPKEPTVRNLAKLFNQVEELWVNYVFGKGLGPLFPEDFIREEQKKLAEGAVVSIISCRYFLEVSSTEIKNVVVSNLGRGVTYVYYSPSQIEKTAFGSDAASSYAKFFADVIHNHRFPSTPNIRGFAVRPSTFPFLSKLHTLVHYDLPNDATTPSKTYAFIEIDQAAGDAARVWYPIPASMWKRVEAELNRSVAPIADSELSEYHFMNPRLNKVRLDYIDWFNHEATSKAYARLSKSIAHGDSRCVETIKEEIFLAQRERDKNQLYLDIGSGDGTITVQLAKKIAGSSGEVSPTLLDPSHFQLDHAKESFGTPSGWKFENHTLEKFQANGGFHVITSIHSAYTLDDGYFRKIYDLLLPGGIACIWMGTLKDNVVNRLADAFDERMRGGQRRNYAEDVAKILEQSGLKRSSKLLIKYVGTWIPTTSLIEKGRLNDAGKTLASFCALSVDSITKDMEDLALKTIKSFDPQGHGRLPIADVLMVFQKS